MDHFSEPMLTIQPFRRFAFDRISDSLRDCGDTGDSRTAEYLADLLTAYLSGGPAGVEKIGELVRTSDVRLNAGSFDEERRTHKLIGDTLLFWTGVFPERVQQQFLDGFASPVKIGKSSYWVVSTFDHEPYSEQAPLFKQLSERFELYRQVLRAFREGWNDVRLTVN